MDDVPSDRRPKLRFRLAAVVFAIALGTLLYTIVARYGTNDFAHYFTSARLLAAGENPYDIRLDRLPGAGSLHFDAGAVFATDTPVFLALFAPLTRLGQLGAYLAWSVLELLSLWIVLDFSFRLTRKERPLPDWMRLLLAGALMTTIAVQSHFAFSQLQLLLVALILGAFRLVRGGRHALALVLVVLAGLLKLYPLALLPWFAVEAWRARGWRSLVPAVAVGAAAIWLTAGLWPAFWRTGPAVVLSYVTGWPFNVSPTAIVARILGWGGGRPSPGAVRWLWIGVGGAGLAGAYAAAWRLRRREEVRLGVLLCGLVLATPVAWGHYLVWLIPPFVLLSERVYRHPTRGGFLLLAALYLSVLDLATVPLGLRLGGRLALLPLAIPTVGIVALAAWLAWPAESPSTSPRIRAS